MELKEIKFNFRVPWQEICPKCRAILKQRKKEQLRVKNRLRMAKVRIEEKTCS